jgi:hypothetical protein
MGKALGAIFLTPPALLLKGQTTFQQHVLAARGSRVRARVYPVSNTQCFDLKTLNSYTPRLIDNLQRR